MTKVSDKAELKEFLDEKVSQYNRIEFIEHDPISIPHRYTRKEDIEISGFFASAIAWGNRKVIVKNGHRLMDLFGESPHDFVMSADSRNLRKLNSFVHRTFNSDDLVFFVKGLKNMYNKHGGPEEVFNRFATEHSLQPAINEFRKRFFEMPLSGNFCRHIGDPMKGSAAKKMNMYLRWLVRKDKRGVDFGIWKKLSPSQLSCPLDLHSGNTARALGLLVRKQNDSRAVQELDSNLRMLDKDDPVKYDFALFGLGIFEKF